MPDTFEERRRSRRVTVQGLGRGELTTSSTVRLMDISRCGVLLLSQRALEVSQRAELQAALGGESFQATVEARWVGIVEPGAPVRLGTRFLALDEASGRALRQFLRQSLD